MPLRTAVCTLVVALTLVAGGSTRARTSADATSKLSDGEFWRLVTGFSEEGGTFPSDNFVSNETEYQMVIPTLASRIRRGGVYVGVGPDQNFTYITALQPSIAFIVDIRRQNLLHHLLYKAIVELSPTRADFMARLFGRPKPKDLKADVSANALMAAFLDREESPGAFDETYQAVMDRLTKHHHFTLVPGDERVIERILRIFHYYGPDIAYSQSATLRMFGGSVMRLSLFPAFADLMTQTDAEGTNHGYLSDEAHYRLLREMHQRNAIVPVVGDFAGPKALRSVGDWVREHGSTITALYTSNVEQYLFQNGVWRDYYENVRAMPTDETSTFIRAYFPTTTPGGVVMIRPTDPPLFFGPPREGRPTGGFIPSQTLLSTVRELLEGVDAGAIDGYLDVVGISR
ncbi:MAG: hypothetical protein R2752_03225 [Vicinamibacterales bacterium]